MTQSPFTHTDSLNGGPKWIDTYDLQGQPLHKTAWHFLSGKTGRVTIRHSRDGRQEVAFTWNAPPSNPGDLAAFFDQVLPEVLFRAEVLMGIQRALPLALEAGLSVVSHTAFAGDPTLAPSGL